LSRQWPEFQTTKCNIAIPKDMPEMDFDVEFNLRLNDEDSPGSYGTMEQQRIVNPADWK